MEKLFEDSEYSCHRFSCGCHDHKHLMDIGVEIDGKRLILCSIMIYESGGSPLIWRLKQIWNLLRGKEGNLVEFIVRQEDIGELAKLFNKHRNKRGYKRGEKQ